MKGGVGDDDDDVDIDSETGKTISFVLEPRQFPKLKEETQKCFRKDWTTKGEGGWGVKHHEEKEKKSIKEKLKKNQRSGGGGGCTADLSAPTAKFFFCVSSLI